MQQTLSTPPADSDAWADSELARYFSSRLSQSHLQSRLQKEQQRERKLGLEKSALKKIFSARSIARTGLWLCGMRRRGQRNALDLQLVKNDIQLASDHPRSSARGGLQGIRILHLSDLHIDANPAFHTVLAETIANIDADITLITGDFKARSFGSDKQTLQMMSDLAPSIPNLGGQCYGILGNHDSLSLVPELEQLGIKMLLNESITVDVRGSAVHIGGVDDPFYYRCDDLPACAAGLSDPSREAGEMPALAILMAHTPELITQASAIGYDLYLAGHTHGGQLCWPWGAPLHKNTDVSWEYCSGSWRHKEMQGYTSRGSGTSIVDARFFCPPEVTLHTLLAT